jgi:hypothetical protein
MQVIIIIHFLHSCLICFIIRRLEKGVGSGNYDHKKRKGMQEVQSLDDSDSCSELQTTIINNVVDNK